MGSPPPLGSKKEVLKFRSVNSMVIAPASTGRDRSSKTVVTKIDQTKRGMVAKFIPLFRILQMVEMKLIEPKIEEAPARCKLKIAKSTAGPLCESLPERGG